MDEIWKDIPGFPNFQVSNLGRVLGPRGIKKPQIDKDGYYLVRLTGKWFRLNRLVCTIFNGAAPNPKDEALHKDDIKTNNVPDNLYWGNGVDNWEDRKVNIGNVSGENNPWAKLTWEGVREMRKLRSEGWSTPNLAGKFGVGVACVCNILNNKTWIE